MHVTKYDWHTLSRQKVLSVLNTDEGGLSNAEAAERLELYGANKLHDYAKPNKLKQFFLQFHNILIYILLFAAITTIVLHKYVDTIVIVAVVIANAFIGYFQEAKAQHVVEALRKMLTQQASIIRQNKRLRIAAEELVPGDIVYLKNGDKVPADIRLLKSNNLQVDESIITGESLPVEKNTDAVDKDTPLSDRKCLVYSGTFIVQGAANGCVVATGFDTEIGRISEMLTEIPNLATPLIKQIIRFGWWLAIAILLIAIFIFCYGYFVKQYDLSEMLVAAVSIAVAIIPEGLPAVITIALAVGVTRMARHNAIVRYLPAVETLSSVTVICTDKTGTITKNELTIARIITADDSYQVTGSGYNDLGNILHQGKVIHNNIAENLMLLIRDGLLCNDAELLHVATNWQLHGSPVDGALIALALKLNLDISQERNLLPRIDMIPFDSAHKFMATLHHDHIGNSLIFVKGAPERVLELCNKEMHINEQTDLTKEYWQQKINYLASQGMRVLGFAFYNIDKRLNYLSYSDVKAALTMLGVVGIIDPPREEVKSAIAACHQAGVQVKMITGDYPLTAAAISKQVGIESPQILSGENLDALTDSQLETVIETVNIYARTVPEQKLRLIKALRAKGHIIAMTGDGVNDAPALRQADLGLAMGIKGTDVAREASEIVLADDNFASIKYAVEEARNVYHNLKKSILFMLPTGGAEGLAVIMAILLGYLLPITPLQILWVNLVTAVTLALSLAFDPPKASLMAESPRLATEPLISKLLLWRIFIVALLFLGAMFGYFVYAINHGVDLPTARTIVVNTLVFAEAAYLLNCRDIYAPTFNRKVIFGSKPALISIAIVTLLQIAFTYVPLLQTLFTTENISLHHWLTILLIVVLIYFAIELEKWIINRFFNNKAHI